MSREAHLDWLAYNKLTMGLSGMYFYAFVTEHDPPSYDQHQPFVTRLPYR